MLLYSLKIATINILLIALTVLALESLLRACDRELQYSDMSKNVKKIFFYPNWSSL